MDINHNMMLSAVIILLVVIVFSIGIWMYGKHRCDSCSNNCRSSRKTPYYVNRRNRRTRRSN